MAAIRGIVVMGPSGSGKSTLGVALAQSLGWRFIEGDDLHPASNVEKMRSGQPLDDADRAPWLARVANRLGTADDAEGVVASCSALKRSYRNMLREGNPQLLFVLPQLAREELVLRMRARGGHYMPASLLDSQLAALEPLQPDEMFLILDGQLPLPEQIERVRGRLGL